MSTLRLVFDVFIFEIGRYRVTWRDNDARHSGWRKRAVEEVLTIRPRAVLVFELHLYQRDDPDTLLITLDNGELIHVRTVAEKLATARGDIARFIDGQGRDQS